MTSHLGTPTSLPETLIAPDFDPASLNAFSNQSRTSVLLVVFLHLLFLHQWNIRKRRKDLLVSYRIIVQKRQYHKLGLGLLSHPPIQNKRQRGSAQTESSAGTRIGDEGRTDNQQQQQQDIRSHIIAVAKQIVIWAYQSGAALMLYNSHMVWSCRSLEVFYNFSEFQLGGGPDVMTIYSAHPFQYARVLFALTAVAMLIELRFAHMLLRISRKLSISTDSSTIPTTSMDNDTSSDHDGTNHSRIQKKIAVRPIGTLTALSSALLILFREQFEYVPLQVLPFLDNRWLLLGISLPGSVTTIFCLCILAYLSYPNHPGTSVVCGVLSGMLWSAGLTSFAQEPYWGNSLIAVYVLVCCLSVRASGIHDRQWTDRIASSTWLPCIDFVSWNRRGQHLRGGGNGAEEWDRNSISSLNRTSNENSSSFNDDDSSDDSSDVSSDQDGLYGRIPSNFGESFDENDETGDDIEMPLLESGRAQTVRSRRGN